VRAPLLAHYVEKAKDNPTQAPAWLGAIFGYLADSDYDDGIIDAIRSLAGQAALGGSPTASQMQRLSALLQRLEDETN